MRQVVTLRWPSGISKAICTNFQKQSNVSFKTHKSMKLYKIILKLICMEKRNGVIVEQGALAWKFMKRTRWHDSALWWKDSVTPCRVLSNNLIRNWRCKLWYTSPSSWLIVCRLFMKWVSFTMIWSQTTCWSASKVK